MPPLPTPRAPQQLRERFEQLGPDALSDSELLSVLLTGSPPANPERRASRLLEVFGSLRGLASATSREILSGRGIGPTAVPGVGRMSALRVSAAFALGRRVRETPLRPGHRLKGAEEIHAHFRTSMRDLRKERFMAVLLDTKARVIREELISEGILTASLVHPREVFGPAIRESAAAIVLVHNHPSGDPEPSDEDQAVTQRLSAVGELVGIGIHDHIVIGDGRYVSFRERGWL